MRKFVMAAALVAASALSAIAADLPSPVLKAPALFAFETSGWYIGAEVGAAVAKPSVGGQGLFASALINGNLIAAGGTVGGCVGYIRGHAQSWWGLHACGDYQNISASVPVAGVAPGIASRWSATQEVRVGGDTIINWIKSVLPNLGVTGFTFPTFTPPSTSGGINLAAAPHSYFAAGLTEIGISGSFGQSTGATVVVAPMVKAGAIWQALDAAGRPNGGAVDVYAQVSFAGRGVTFNNVFAADGNLMSGGSANMGTIYKAGIGYQFAPPR